MPATLTADETRRARFGDALAEAMRVRQITQAALGELLDEMRQSSISAWRTGSALPPDVETVFRLEKALKLAPGHLSRHLGFLPAKRATAPSVSEAIMADSHLDAAGQRILLTAYQELAAAKRRHPTAHKVTSVKVKRRVA